MQFTTPIEIPAFDHKIDYNDRILMLGSCFSDEMSDRLAQYYFRVTANPYGTLYNPLSIADAITCSDDIHLIEHGGLWHSFRHHGQFSSPDYDSTMRACLNAVQTMQQSLVQASWVMVTFGTAYVYEYEGRVVANCHKFPASTFTRRRLSAEEIVRIWTPILRQYADKQFILTVSPIRHLRDGLHDNQVSKSILLQAVDMLCELPNANYFPSYEIMLDELRDYRFYAEDMLHPSKMAADYIFSRFADSLFTSDTRKEMNELHRLWSDSHHKLLHPDSPESEAFLRHLDTLRSSLSVRYPWIQQL